MPLYGLEAHIKPNDAAVRIILQDSSRNTFRTPVESCCNRPNNIRSCDGSLQTFIQGSRLLCLALFQEPALLI